MSEEDTERKVAKGDKVSVYYKGTLEDGTEFDSNFDGKPLEFTVGGGEMIRGFDRAVIGMKVNETKKVTLKPAEAYGEPKLELITEVPTSAFGDQKAEEGMGVQTDRGQQGIITKIENDKATIDFNPPLAGKTLNFEIKLDKIE